MLGPTGNLYSERIERSKLHCIANQIAPQTAICGDYDCVVFTDLNFFQRYCLQVIGIKSIHWYEFVENTVIKHQQHFIAAGLVLNPKKSSACIKIFMEIDVFPNDLTVLLRVGLKAETPMKKLPQFRP